MGGFVSKRELGLLEGDDQSPFSCAAAAAPKHFLPREFDSRSPSAGIDRTPILKTSPREPLADPQSTLEGIARGPTTCLPSQSDESECSTSQPVAEAPKHFLPREFDPRSPSVGIDRTPILVPVTKEMIADPRSPSDGIVRTPIASLPTESGDISMDILLPECVDAKPWDSSPVLEIAKIDLDKSESSEVANDRVYTDSPTITSKGVDRRATDGEKSSSNTPVSYAVSPDSSKLFGPSSTGQRSPLAPRNFVAPRSSSTPRHIIQRKQSAHVEKMRSMDIPTSVTKRQLESSLDKENL